jgi:CRP-like cAMP-binding protein
VPPALPVQRNREAFLERAPRLRRFPLLRGLPPEELELLSDRLIHKTHGQGETFFHENVPSSRMFFIEHGRVSLVDPITRHREPVVLGEDDAFGGLSLLTGAVHATTAVATSDTSVWELRRPDLDELLRRAPVFAQRVRDFVAGGEAAEAGCEGFHGQEVVLRRAGQARQRTSSVIEMDDVVSVLPNM